MKIQKIDISKIPSSCFTISEIFKNAGYESHLVGGCVRDLLIGKEPKDFDFCTNATVDDIKSLLKEKGISYTSVGEEYGTIVAHFNMWDDNHEEYEITTFRKDAEYKDGRHPSKIEATSSLVEDLKRRDFTINAMAYSILDGIITDPFNGQKDLEENRLMCVGDASKRFKEDGLRLLRAVRFACKYNLNIEHNTYFAMKDNVDILDNVSKERITNEFKKLFGYDCKIADVFDECNFIITKVIPEIADEIGCSQKSKYHYHDVWKHSLSVVDNVDINNFVVKLAALLHDIGKPYCKTTDEAGYEHFYDHPEKSYKIVKQVISKDFVLTCEEQAALLELVRYHDTPLASTDKSVKKFVSKHGNEMFGMFVSLKQADFLDHVIEHEGSSKKDFYFDKDKVEEIYRNLIESEQCFKLKDLKVNGYDLMKMGIPKGPQIGEVLNMLLELVLDEQLLNDKGSLMDYVKENVLDLSNDEIYEI